MKMTLTEWEFVHFMWKADTNFTLDGLRMLFHYLEGIEEATGEQIEFDPTALRCEFSEMSASEFVSNYVDKEMSPTEIEDYLIDHTVYVGRTDGGNYVFREF
jgi:hypothetical protein